jgi:SAM-dependent methyltransferase
VRSLLASSPYERAMLLLFAELVHAGGGGPVADVGCGPGRITAHLRTLDVDAFGIDLSPGMIEVARRDHPGLRFEVGSMTDLAVARYGGHPMKVQVHRRQPARLETWLREAGFTIEAQLTLTSPESKHGGILCAHRSS